jgi:hypothetical protein
MKKLSFAACRNFIGLLLCLLAFLFAGCTTPRTAAMVPKDISGHVSHSEKVFVNVRSQAVTNDFEQHPVVNPEFIQSFHDALVQSLIASKLYQVGDSAGTSDFELEVAILRGGPGAEKDVGNAQVAPSTYMIARWRFKRVNTSAVVCEKDITTAGVDDRFFGPSKQRNATEQSVSGNIQAGLGWLARKTQ